MGVRGLTTYIARNSEKYLENHQLHDSYLVIDGNNLAAQLYKWHTQCYDCFGGDYDIYTKAIKDFFAALEKCNITPLVIFDGCYEDKKLKTIYSRVLNRVKSAKRLNASTENSVQVFPLFLRELFTETVIKLGCKTVRCEFEADYEMACIARTLNCPVLSYDSDFYIFDVLYLPFSHFNSECKRIKKKNGTSHYVIVCKIYKIDNFLNSLGGMDKSNLPLLAVLLGNDYIKMSVFRNFYNQLKLVKKKSAVNEGQRRIETVIKWLRNENYESAAKKILGRIKLVDRKNVADRIKEVADGYICTESKVLPYFEIEAPALVAESKSTAIDLESIPDECEDEALSEDDCESDSSEANLDIGEVIPLEVDNLSEHFPVWFLNEYRKCNFPAWFMDIALHNRYFFIPQIENYDDTHSHHISVPLLAALHKILTNGKKDSITYIARNINSIKNFDLETSDIPLPTLEEIGEMNAGRLQMRLLAILSLPHDITPLLEKFPADWHIVIISIVYWVENSHIRVSNTHLYSLILSAITLKIVDQKVGLLRTLASLNKYEKDLKDETEAGDISKRDCINFLREIIPYFYMDEKMCRNPRLYDVNIVDSFSRFQSALFHIKYLNKVLRCPYEDISVSDFYNGTVVCGVYANLIKRDKPLTYLENVFSNAPGIWKYFKTVSEVLVSVVNTTDAEAIKKRRKKRNRNKNSDGEEEVKVLCVDEEDKDKSVLIDVNNQYSILNLVAQ